MRIRQLDLFPELPLMDKAATSKEKEKLRWQRLKNKNFGMEYCSAATFSGKYGIPLLRPYRDELPDTFINLSETSIIGPCGVGITCFDF